MSTCKLIAYYRVSGSARQRASGLGLEAQRDAVADYVAQSNCDLVAEYTEVETAKRHTLDNRPQLAAAVSHALRDRATLVVAKIDRLYRSTVVRSLLKTKGVRFVACDLPAANELTIDILAAVAEDESRRISERTRAALAVAKRRGALLGANHPRAKRLSLAARRKGAKAAGAAHHGRALDRYAGTFEQIVTLRRAGKSLGEIAGRLNEQERSDSWHATKVMRVLRYFRAA